METLSIETQFDHLGDPAIWQLPKTAFLCSRKAPAAQVLKYYDWAIAMREAGVCVMLGAHSQLEKDVLHYLLKGEQPVVLVLARGMKKQLEPVCDAEVRKGRLLLLAPFPPKVKRVTAETALVRNRFLVEHAQQIVLGHMAPEGGLSALIAASGKEHHVL